MSIKAKDTATILPRHLLHYDPLTFEQHKKANFIEATAEQVLAMIKPCVFDFLPDKKFISVDTETFYTGVPSNRLPSDVVRRWIKTPQGKYIPTDFPFCITICDLTHAFVVYDTLQNGFKEFKKLQPLLCDATISKVGHNFDYDLHMLANSKTNMKGHFHDTMYLSKLTRADAFTHRLLDIAEEIYDSEEYPSVAIFEHMVDSYKGQYRVTDYRQIPHELMTQYTCADVWNTMLVFKALYPRMLANNQTEIYGVESEMMLVAYDMERTGIKLAAAYENVLIPELKLEVDEAEKRIYDTAGTTFNINSSAQVVSVLTKLGYGHLIKYNKPTEAMLMKGTVEGNPKLDKNEMERLEDEGVPLIVDIMTYRKAQKLLNTFAIKLYEMMDFNCTVHCNINTMEAKTGRFSISAPSMQNMPRRKDSRVRGAFIAPEGATLYDFDFKSQESIILTHYSRSVYLMDIINSGGDIHKAVASLIYSIPIEEITKALREIAKSVEFAIVYGAGPMKVHVMTNSEGKKGLTVEEASIAIKSFLRHAPEVDTFIRDANKIAKERRKIKTILGRIVCIERGREYACVNYVCQGSAADSTKSRMVEIYKFLKANKFKTKMILQVHDSLLQQVVHEEESFILGYLRWLQTERKLFRVPVTVDVAKCVPTWRNKEDVNVDAVEPPPEMMEKMRNYNIWEEGII